MTGVLPSFVFWVQQIIQNSMGVHIRYTNIQRIFTHGHPGWKSSSTNRTSGVYHDRRDPDESAGKPEPPSATSAGLRGPSLRPMRVSGSSAAITLTKNGTKLVLFSNKDVFLVYVIPVDCLLLIDNHSLLEGNGVRPKNKLRSKQLRCTYFWPPEQRHGEINSPAYQWISQ